MRRAKPLWISGPRPRRLDKNQSEPCWEGTLVGWRGEYIRQWAVGRRALLARQSAYDRAAGRVVTEMRAARAWADRPAPQHTHVLVFWWSRADANGPTQWRWVHTTTCLLFIPPHTHNIRYYFAVRTQPFYYIFPYVITLFSAYFIVSTLLNRFFFIITTINCHFNRFSNLVLSLMFLVLGFCWCNLINFDFKNMNLGFWLGLTPNIVTLEFFGDFFKVCKPFLTFVFGFFKFFF